MPDTANVALDHNSQTLAFVKWIEWFETQNGFVPTRVKIQRGLMQAICWENGMPLSLTDYGIIGICVGLIPDA